MTVDVEQYRRRLTGIAYRMLGSMSEAEDAVQEAYLRWHRSSTDAVQSPEAWLVTALTRLCIDRLRVMGRERAAYPGEWLPEPVAEGSEMSPERRAEIADDLTIAFLVLLDRLSADERVAFVLREGFQYPYEEIGAILGKRPDACRQLVHRAKESVKRARPWRAAALHQRRRIVRDFLNAMERGDEKAVVALISPQATWRADGGGKAPATTTVLQGREVLAKLALGFAAKGRGLVTWDVVDLVGEPALGWWHEGRLIGVWTIDTDGEQILGFNNILNPDKLANAAPTQARSRSNRFA